MTGSFAEWKSHPTVRAGLRAAGLLFAGLVVFLRPALEAGFLLRAIDAPSLQNFVLRGHFWPFRELIALASSS